MAKATKTKAANVCVPQTREDAATQVARIGLLQRELETITTKMNEKLAATKQAAEVRAAPAKAEIEDLTEGLRVYCDANREALTRGKVKFFDFGTGIVRWRQTKAAVRGVPRDAEKFAALVATIRAKGLVRFLREIVEIDKEAMLREPDAVAAAGLPGVKISAEGEDFVVEPYAETLSKEIAA